MLIFTSKRWQTGVGYGGLLSHFQFNSTEICLLVFCGRMRFYNRGWMKTLILKNHSDNNQVLQNSDYSCPNRANTIDWNQPKPEHISKMSRSSLDSWFEHKVKPRVQSWKCRNKLATLCLTTSLSYTTWLSVYQIYHD